MDELKDKFIFLTLLWKINLSLLIIIISVQNHIKQCIYLVEVEENARTFDITGTLEK